MISCPVAHPPTAQIDSRHNPIRLLVVSADDALAALLEGCCCTLEMAVRVIRDIREAAELFVLGEVEMAFVDEAIGVDEIAAFLHRLRDELCVDWAPVVVVGDPVRLRPALREAAPGMVDHVLRKPIDHDEMHERIVASRRLVSLQRAFRSTLDRVGEAVIVSDGGGRIHTFNAAAQRLFQWQDSEIRGANLSRLMPPRQRQAHDGYLAQYHATGQTRVIGKGRVESGLRRDGTQFPMHLTVNDISDSYGVRFVGVIRDLTQDQEREDLRVRALHDALTTLPNHAYADQRLRLACDEARLGGEAFALIYLDLDRFKPINDTLGHQAGDEVLRAVARRLRHAVNEKDFVARLGGDEFLLLLFDIAEVAQARSVVDRLMSSLRRPVTIGKTAVEVGASAGIALFGQDGTEAQGLLQVADQAMYVHKRHPAR
jgi:diguanylate cyclase (GGDEF)-like protein/PAS domain S-box-containing protein